MLPWLFSPESGKPQKLAEPFTCHDSSISSTESDVNIRFVKAWTGIDSLSILWKSDPSNKIKQDIF